MRARALVFRVRAARLAFSLKAEATRTFFAAKAASSGSVASVCTLKAPRVAVASAFRLKNSVASTFRLKGSAAPCA